MKKIFGFTCLLFVIGFIFSSTNAEASIKVRVLRSGASYKILSVEKSMRDTTKEKQVLARSIPYILSEGPDSSKDLFQEYIFNENFLPQDVKNFMIAQVSPEKIIADAKSSFPGSEVRVLMNQGPKENRINLTILGDGYTEGERAKFFDDAVRTTHNLFTGATFASYLPLFNVYAVFTPSAVSGIGDGTAKNTVFRLFRQPAGSKRAIMPGNQGALEDALKLAPATDYPIVLANDEFYGGLGGRYAISTRSVRSGMIVLRHDLGHNFGEVGEEYDGGYVYSGANSSPSTAVPWAHWADGGVKVNEALHLAGDYVWQNLKSGPFNQSFNFPTSGAIFLADISSVGWSTPNDVSVTFDGKPLQLKGDFHNDRNFYEVGPVTGISAGKHSFSFTENIHDGDNVLAFSNVYALPADYDFTTGKIGAYATFDDGGHKTYRPTHDSCLMRNMLTPNFCSVDKENMWHKFLNRVNLVDGVAVAPVRGNKFLDSLVSSEKVVTLAAPKLAGLQIFWFQVGGGKEVELTQYRNMATWKAPAELAGNFKVKVNFVTPEVRRYSKSFTAEKSFTL